MSSLKRFDDNVWDKFFDSVLDCDELTTDAELDAELRRLKINVAPAVNRVLEAAKTTRARQKLRLAREQRPSALTRLGEIIPTTVDNVRQNIEDLISRLSRPQQALHFRKLRNTSSNQDLLSLYEDMQRLNEMAKDKEADDDEQSTK